MDVFFDLITRVRALYIEQFVDFIETQKRQFQVSAPELKLQLSETSAIYRRLYCMDFVSNDGDMKMVELHPNRTLAFQPFEFQIGATKVAVQQLHWDDVLLIHDLDPLPAELYDWFEHWFDPEDKRQDAIGDLSNIIHGMQLQPREISIDFGTAQSEALMELLKLFAEAGATVIDITSSRAH